MLHLVCAIFQLWQFGGLYNNKGSACQLPSSCVPKLARFLPSFCSQSFDLRLIQCSEMCFFDMFFFCL